MYPRLLYLLGSRRHATVPCIYLHSTCKLEGVFVAIHRAPAEMQLPLVGRGAVNQSQAWPLRQRDFAREQQAQTLP